MKHYDNLVESVKALIATQEDGIDGATSNDVWVNRKELDKLEAVLRQEENL